MRLRQKKTVRFTKLVEESGRPEEVMLWTPPEENRAFMKAVGQNRVVTVIYRNVGTRADYGLVGFFKERPALYLVFPKRLQHPSETKIIGIKYEQVAESKPKGPLAKPARERPPGIRMREQAPTPVEREPPTPKQAAPQTPAEPARHRSAQAAPAKNETPKRHRFRSEVKIVATEIVPVEVEARSAAEAAKLVAEKLQEIKPDLQAARVKRTATRPRRQKAG